MSMSTPLRITRPDPIASDSPRFVVAGQQGSASGDVKMYEWDRQMGNMRLIGLQTDVGQVRTLAWSPSPSHRHLISLGLATGRTLLLSLTPQTLSFPLTTPSTTSPLPASTVCFLPVKHVRPVTSMSFCKADHNYLATGYERHRSDYSLLVWDLSTALSVVSPDGDGDWQRPLDRLETTNALARDATRLNPSEPRHIQHYCPSEHVNDLAFLTGYQLLASANGKAIRLYDLRAPGPSAGNASPRDPVTAHHAGAASQWLTRAVYGLAPDPTQEHRFASYESSMGASSSTVRLWDSRKTTGEIIGFEAPGQVTGIEWVNSGTGTNKLGVGTKEGVSLWDLVDGTDESDTGVSESMSIGGARTLVKPKQLMHSFAFANSTDQTRRDVLFVVKDGTIGIGPVVNPPLIASGPRGDAVISASQLSIVDPDAPSSEMGTPDGRASDASDGDDDDDEIIRANRFQLAPSRVTDILAEANRSRTNSPSSSIFGGLKGSTGRRRVELVSKSGMDARRDNGEIGWSGLTNVLRTDVGWVMRRRAEEGYGLSNLLLNAAISTRYPGHDRLAGIWEFIEHLTKVMDPATSTTRSLSLTYAGIHSIWTGYDLSNIALSPISTSSMLSHSTLVSGISRAASHTSTPREPVKQSSMAWASLRNTQIPARSHSTPIASPSPAPNTPEKKEATLPDADFAAAVDIMNAKRETAEHPGKVGGIKLPETEKVAQRRMILAVCGEKDVGEVNRLIEDDNRTRAASWAYFSGEEENAVRILMNSDNTKHRLFGTTLAGFLSQTYAPRGSASSFFDEHWRSLVNRVDDPYLRAVLSRIRGDGWESVLEEEAIPLVDRVAIAACNLSDNELGDFIKRRLARFTRNPSPSLASLVLTGFTAPAVPLMQKWLERTGDVQSISLLASFFPINRLSPSERESVRRWTESYRSLLDGWGLWGERVEFDIGRMDIGRALGEERVADEEESQGRGTCPVCNNVLSRTHEEHLQLKSGLSREKSLPNERTGACTLCGQVLPRCVICLRHVEAKFSTAHAHDFDNLTTTNLSATDTIEQAYVCCLTCRHGGHANHILSWFQGNLDGIGGNDTCPVAGCPCECANI